MAMITTAKSGRWPSDYRFIRPKEAGLVENCYVRWKVFTMPNELIVHVIGEPADEDRESLMIQARTIFIRP